MSAGNGDGGWNCVFTNKCFLTFFKFSLPECKEVSLPVDKSLKEVIQFLKSKIDQGISASQLIVPQKFEKILLRRGKIITEEESIQKKRFAHKNSQRSTYRS